MNHHKANRSVVIAAGGTGGHILPALAISDYLASNTDYKPIFITDDRGVNFVDSPHSLLKHIIIPTSRFELGISLLYSVPSLIKSTIKLIFELHKLKTKAVLGFGGYASFPVLLAAGFLGIPIILHESNAMIGRTNRYFLPFCKKIMLNFINTIGISNKHRHKIEVTGTPIRKNILKILEDSLSHKKNEFKILVIGGSQGSKIMSEIVPLAVLKLPLELREKLIIWHQARPEQVDSTIDTYNKAKLKESTVAPFFRDTELDKDDKSISALMQHADLIIARAGAGTISEIATLGKASILIPFAAAKDNHQYYNAKSLVDCGATIMVEEGDDALEKLTAALEILIKDAKLRNKMGGKALTNLHANSPAAITKIIDYLTN